MGAKLVGFSKDIPTDPSLFEAFGLKDLMVDLRGDVTDLTTLTKAIADAKPDIVLHLAAQSLVRLSYSTPVETYATNVMGTVNVLEAARHTPSVKLALMVTSDKCYENREWIWSYRENDPMGGFDPYSSSKGCSELVTAAYARSFAADPNGIRFLSARAGNVIGGGDWALDRLIPDLMRGLISGNPLQIRSPHSIRPWQHVLEPLSGYFVLAERAYEDASFASQGWNFGPGSDSEQTVATIANRICDLWPNPKGWVDVSDPNQVHEAHLLKLDSTKARVQLGWVPRWSLEDALDASVQFYREHATGGNMQAFGLKQIAAYTA
jgi:CDP-glucose 4,6-dehydratase